MGSSLVELVRSQYIFQSQKIHVGAERHLAHAVRVEVELVLYDLREMLEKGWPLKNILENKFVYVIILYGNGSQ